MKNKIIHLKTLIKYLCQWDDLLDKYMKVHATVYTLRNAKKDPPISVPKLGITKGEDDVWDIIIDVPELTKDIVRNSLKELTKITGTKYVF